MAVERFKTQVMILHPEQTMLDACAQSLGDDYTVHLVRSGREALSTLGETPIDLIICTHDLPGMSGAEALREARRRSPDTRGILLATPSLNDAELAALAGSGEFFRVLRGGKSSDEIRAIVEEVVSKTQLEELQESANDSVHPRREEPVVAGSGDKQEPFISTVTDLPTAGMRAHEGGKQIEVLVLSQDATFHQSIDGAAHGMHKVHHAPTLQEAIDVINLGRIGVLVTDAAVAPSDVEVITTRLRSLEPSLVTIVAGRRDDGDALMDLISTGTVYRFLLKPVSAGRARLAIEASVKRSLELRDAPPEPPRATRTLRSTVLDLAYDDDNGWSIGRIAAISLLLLAVIAGAGYFYLTGLGDETEPATITEAPAPVPDAAPGVDSAEPDADSAVSRPPPTALEAEIITVEPTAGADDGAVAELRRQAFRALAEGRVAMPDEDNALSLYADAMILNPGADGLAAEFQNALDEALAQTETALLDSRTEDAAAIIARIREVRPYEARLPFLEGQLRKEQRRALVDEARRTAAGGDTEGALELLDRAAALSAVSDPAVSAARDELLAAEDSRELEQLLSLANARLASGQLLAPASDNARFYYRAVLQRDADNAAAQQGLKLVATTLLTDAREALAAGDLALAEGLADEARSSGANADEADAIVAGVRDAQAREAAEAERAAAAEAASAGTADTAGAASNDTATADAGSPGAPEGAEKPTADSAPEKAGAPDAAPVISADLNDALPALQQSDVVRIQYVQPQFPRAALRRNRSGFVDLEYTIDTDGSVADIEVVYSEPGDIFVKSASRALSQWRYQPITDSDGTPVARRAIVRIQFAVE